MIKWKDHKLSTYLVHLLFDQESELSECDEWVYDRSIFEETLTTEFDLVCGHNTLGSISPTILHKAVQFYW